MAPPPGVVEEAEPSLDALPVAMAATEEEEELQM